MGWDTSSDFETSSLGSNGLVFKSVMVKTRKEKGKESELHVRTIHMSLLRILLKIGKRIHNFINIVISKMFTKMFMLLLYCFLKLR